MLLVLSGSSGAGKTAIGPLVAARLDHLTFHDSDEYAPALDDRPGTIDHWLRVALGYEERSRDMLLATQSPLGEILACPAAVELQAIAGCVLDCDDFVRAERIRARGPQGAQILGMDILCWAVFHRMHARDPQWEQRVICDKDGPTHHWGRWKDWTAADARWQVPVFDTSTVSIEATAMEIVTWVTQVRARPPLARSNAWWHAPDPPL